MSTCRSRPPRGRRVEGEHQDAAVGGTPGPTTAAIRAMLTEPEPARRSVLQTAVAGLVGDVVGYPTFKAKGPDLAFVAECWVRDLRDLGMWFIVGPDGELWRTVPIHDGSERARQREELWIKLVNRPRLMRAFRDAARRLYQQDVATYQEAMS